MCDLCQLSYFFVFVVSCVSVVVVCLGGVSLVVCLSVVSYFCLVLMHGILLFVACCLWLYVVVC